MKKPSHIITLIIIFSLSSTHSMASRGGPPTPTTTWSSTNPMGFSLWKLKFEVHIINALPPNTPPLTAHCYSKDDEIGTHTIGANQEMVWSFKSSTLVYVTMFACHFWWGQKDISFEVFDAQLRKHYSLGFKEPVKYNWVVREDGFILVLDETFKPPFDPLGSYVGDRLHTW